MILFENITKKYGSKTILDDLNLEIETGQFICLTGPSGAGKTTLVTTLIGAESINHGKIMIDNYTISNLHGAALQLLRRKIGMVFQDYRLLPQKTVFENVAFALEVCGAPDREIHKKVNEVLELVGLHNHKKHFPRQLSGGEQQRTAIARALVHDPVLLIADEPTGNLDLENALAIADLLIEINNRGTTVMLTTHNKELLNAISGCRVVTLMNGHIIKDVVKK